MGSPHVVQSRRTWRTVDGWSPTRRRWTALEETCSVQDVEDGFNRQRWIAQRGCLIVKNLQQRITIDIEEHRHELIRVHRHQVESAERRLGKVAKVERDDDGCIAMERGCDDMTVVGVWQLDFVDPMFVARDAGIANRGLHQRSRSSQRGGGQIWPIAGDVSEALIEYRGTPPSPV